ncbi:hypothetical protein H4K35_03835 [Myroides sp. NP-2]|uniref:hypothetical protein n=1 Tax=Myroides sp. NP-2 TaxID=2759945 RepID=UPI0015FCA8AA|nr:hypothetical protein [Myroides sp. NP-2]MBB1149271.1 hypothetical protein [Myroides sp. NP-2]
MRNLLASFTILTLLFSSCANDEANTQERAQNEWTNFIQKHLLGEWKPQSITVRPLLGHAFVLKEYSSLGNDADVVRLHKDYTGVFQSLDALGQVKNIPFTWYHKLDELGIQLQDDRVLKTILLNKSSTELELSINLAHVEADLIPLIPELKQIKDKEHYVVYFYFVK